jgi:hypothetical protein
MDGADAIQGLGRRFVFQPQAADVLVQGAVEITSPGRQFRVGIGLFRASHRERRGVGRSRFPVVQHPEEIRILLSRGGGTAGGQADAEHQRQEQFSSRLYQAHALLSSRHRDR